MAIRIRASGITNCISHSNTDIGYVSIWSSLRGTTIIVLLVSDVFK